MTEQDEAAASALRLMGHRVRDFGGTMNIETFETEELPPEPAIEAEALELIEKLDLKGQKSLVQPEKDGDDDIRYKELTKGECAMFESMFDKKENVRDYRHMVMPIRVLQVAAHGKELFTEVQVWYSDESPEFPFLVGLIGPSYSTKKKYLLARWSPKKLQPMEKLREVARATIRGDIEKKLKACIAKCNEHMANIEDLVDKTMAGDSIYLPS